MAIRAERRARRGAVSAAMIVALAGGAAVVVVPTSPAFGGGCVCNDGSYGCCGRGCCSHHGGIFGPAPEPAAAPPAPAPQRKPASVSFLAFPGGKILVDGQLAGRDATGTMVLKPGAYTVRIENRFLGTETRSITLDDGQTGVIAIHW
jgi:hypothetical protein